MNGLLISLVLSAVTVPGRDQWNADYHNALKEARSKQKALVVVLENSENPAEAFNQSALGSDKKVASLLGKYELCRIDVSTDYGKKIAAAFGANEFPVTVVSDAKCKVIRHRKVGSPTVKVWRTMLAQNARPRPNQTSQSPIRYQYRPSASRVCYT